MRAFTQHKGIVVPLDRANVDTDMIIPKQFLKSIKRSGFGPNLFDEMRYLDEAIRDRDCSARPLNSEFVMNQPRYQGKHSFSTPELWMWFQPEHAPWALDDYGIRAVIAPALRIFSSIIALRMDYYPLF